MEQIQTMSIAQNRGVEIQKYVALFSYFVLCIRGYLGSLGVNTIYITLFLNVLILLAIDFRHARKTIWLFPFLSLLLIYNKDALALIDIIAMVYVLRGISINKVILINAGCLLLFICCWLYALALGFLKSEVFVMPKGIAQTLGFENPNGLGFLGFQIISALYLVFRKYSLIVLLIITLAINELFFSISVSRTPWVGGFAFSFILLLMILGLLRSWMRYAIGLLPIVLSLLIFYFTIKIDSYPELEVLFTTRFSLYASIINQMSIVNWIIGAKIPAGMPMDGSYMCLLFEAGIVGLIFFLKAFNKSIVKHFDDLRLYMPFIIGMLACGVAENTFSSATGISVIFWFLFLNSDNLYGNRTKLGNRMTGEFDYSTQYKL